MCRRHFSLCRLRQWRSGTICRYSFSVAADAAYNASKLVGGKRRETDAKHVIDMRDVPLVESLLQYLSPYLAQIKSSLRHTCRHRSLTASRMGFVSYFKRKGLAYYINISCCKV